MNAPPVVNSLGEPFRVVDMEDTIREVMAMLQWQAERLYNAAEKDAPGDDSTATGAIHIAEKLKVRLYREWTQAVENAQMSRGSGVETASSKANA